MTTLEGTTTYGYDADSQLISVTLPDNGVITYGYDAMGNRNTVTQDGVTTAYATNDLNQYTAVGANTYGYDKDGNLTVTTGAAGTTTYTYDALNQLIGVHTPTDTWGYTYDALGNLIASTHNGQTTRYLVDPRGDGTVLAEYDGSGTLIANYTYGIDLASRVDGSGAPAYYDFDATGNTTGLSGQGGGYIDSYSYLPFGELSGASGSVPNPFQYGGQAGVMTAGNGLDLMRARFYSPSTGRFIQGDPTGLNGGANRYAYVANDPVNLVDPTGLAGVRPGGGNYVNSSQGGTYDITTGRLQYGDQVVNPGRTQVRAEGEEVEILSLIGSAASALAARAGAAIVDAAVATAEFAGQFGLYIVLGVTDVLVLSAFVYEWYELQLDIIGAFKVSHSTIAESPTDPNFISGPSGYGTPEFVPDGGAFPYAINFENKPSAPAPAQVVEVTQQLDPNLDWSTFQLGDFGFGGLLFAVPPGLKAYQTRIDARSTTGVYVDVDAALDEQTGVVTWTFTSIDPTTFDVPAGNPEEGFLPPDNTSDAGTGFVTYTVAPRSADATGSLLGAKATVTFQAGLPDESSLDTAPISNTLDVGAPNSTVAALPATSPPTFTVHWAGQDDAGGSGIASFDIYVSDDGGPFTAWLTGTPITSADYTGQDGHTYAFYSVATDNVGHIQATPATAQATTTVHVAQATNLAAVSGSGAYGGTATLTATLTADGAPLAGRPVTFTLTAGGRTTPVGTATTGADGIATLRVSLAGLTAGTAAGAVGAGFAGDATDAPISASGDLVVARATPRLSWANPADIVYGTALGPVQLDASASFAGDTLPGTFTYTPAAGTVLHAGGGQTLSVRFTPSDSTDFGAATATVSINVKPAPLTVTAVDGVKVSGQSNPPFSARYTGFVLGQDQSVLDGSLTFTTSATKGSQPGQYAIAVSGVASPD
jgi:RHS repeat-associated protein